jgi:hypothetical protein
MGKTNNFGAIKSISCQASVFDAIKDHFSLSVPEMPADDVIALIVAWE